MNRHASCCSLLRPKRASTSSPFRNSHALTCLLEDMRPSIAFLDLGTMAATDNTANTVVVMITADMFDAELRREKSAIRLCLFSCACCSCVAKKKPHRLDIVTIELNWNICGSQRCTRSTKYIDSVSKRKKVGVMSGRDLDRTCLLKKEWTTLRSFAFGPEAKS